MLIDNEEHKNKKRKSFSPHLLFFGSLILLGIFFFSFATFGPIKKNSDTKSADGNIVPALVQDYLSEQEKSLEENKKKQAEYRKKAAAEAQRLEEDRRAIEYAAAVQAAQEAEQQRLAAEQAERERLAAAAAQTTTTTTTTPEAPEQTVEAPATVPESANQNSVWDDLAWCESRGNWHMNSGNGFYGGLQFMHSTWLNMGGGQYAHYPHEATREQQIEVASRLQAQYGWGQWPACSSALGLR